VKTRRASATPSLGEQYEAMGPLGKKPPGTPANYGGGYTRSLGRAVLEEIRKGKVYVCGRGANSGRGTCTKP